MCYPLYLTGSLVYNKYIAFLLDSIFLDASKAHIHLLSLDKEHFMGIGMEILQFDSWDHNPYR